jgi:hypothetical protein
MGGQLLHVEQHETVRREDALGGGERQVGEMLVIDGVELLFGHEPQQVREFHRDHAARLESDLHAGDEIVDVGNVGEHVVAQQEIGLPARVAQFRRGLHAEETHVRRDPFRDRGLRDVRRGLDSQHRYSLLAEVLQQVTVVAGDFHDLARRAETEALGHRDGVGPGMLEPRIRVGGEIRVVAEDAIRRLELGQLDQETSRADVGMQRIELLHRLQLAGGEVGIGKRRHAQVAEGLLERRIAEAAGMAHVWASAVASSV